MFLAHKSDLSHSKPLLQYNGLRLITANDSVPLVLNNVCPHQASKIITAPASEISCRYHGWSWNSAGEPTSSGCTNVCNTKKLRSWPVYESEDLLFDKKIDLSSIGIDFSHFQLVEERVDIVRADWRTIVDVFLDVDHIPVVHRGVYDNIGILDVSDIQWQYYNWGSVQTVSQTTQRDDAFSSTLIGVAEEKIAAVWITVYPGTMIEWQPGAMFITVALPDNQVCVFKYRDKRYNDKNWKINSDTWEIAWQQDREQSEAMVKFPTKNLEPAKKHFRNWLS